MSARVLHLVSRSLLPPDMWRLSKVFIPNTQGDKHTVEIPNPWPGRPPIFMEVYGWMWFDEDGGEPVIVDAYGRLEFARVIAHRNMAAQNKERNKDLPPLRDWNAPLTDEEKRSDGA